MSDISKIDANFAESTCIKGGEFINIDENPFKLYGVMKDETGYCRMPQSVADKVSEGVPPQRYRNAHDEKRIYERT